MELPRHQVLECQKKTKRSKAFKIVRFLLERETWCTSAVYKSIPAAFGLLGDAQASARFGGG